MIRINLAEFDVGFFREKKVKVREYNRVYEMWREIAHLHAPLFAGIMIGGILLLFVV